MWKVRSAAKSKSSKILWLSSLPVNLTKIDQKWNRYHPNNIFRSLWGPQGRLTLMPIVETWPNWTCPRFYICPRYLHVWCRSDQKWNRCRPDNVFPIKCLWETKGQVPLMWIVRSVSKSNLSKILWLSSLSASLMKSQSQMKSLSCGQHFPKSLGPSRADNSHANSGNWAKIELIRDLCLS